MRHAFYLLPWDKVDIGIGGHVKRAQSEEGGEAPTFAFTRYQVVGSNLPRRPTRPSIAPKSVSELVACLSGRDYELIFLPDEIV